MLTNIARTVAHFFENWNVILQNHTKLRDRFTWKGRDETRKQDDKMEKIKVL